MAVITGQDDYYTLVNVFKVAPEHQTRVYDAIVGATDVIRALPGFVSANVHLTKDGVHVVNYAQWRSKADFDAMLVSPGVEDHFRVCRELAEMDTILCRTTALVEAA